MSSNFFNSVLSVFLEAGGQGIARGSKGIALSGLRKLGWAQPAEQKGGRLQGPKIGGHSFGAGRKVVPQTPTINKKKENTKPRNLSGRQDFQAEDTLSGSSDNRWIRKDNNASKSYSKNPRGFIKF